MSQPSLKDHLAAARLDDRVYVVLGAGGGGIGDATCVALAGAGAEIVCVDRVSEHAESIAAAVGGVAYVADVTRRAEMAALFESISGRFGERFAGVIDIVGIAKLARIDALDDAAIDRQFDVVLRHAMLTVQIAAPLLARRGGGSLSFIGSLAGMAAMPDLSFYGIAKAALLQLVRCAALEFGPAGVRVNAVVPGYTSTPRLLEMLPAETWERVAANNPLRRVATPQDIAKALLFLVSDLADYVTGNILTLDGGVSQALLVPGTG
ncbi:MAG TPA: SDR family oxidoreductase [Steroidobacter sp.]|uniref:SDR family NAD(P)-dependent oxidoreductase n=1 Tax=Steroidobacter sp. TaxID=1978227 RepID=UPI002ED869E6